MKKLLLSLAASLFTAASFAQGVVVIGHVELGSGTPGHEVGSVQALPVLENDIYHAPQYMPMYPTAATIWPRIIEVPCEQVGTNLKCDGYQWSPKYGRGEYLFFKPIITQPVPPAAPTIVPVIVERKVFVEVPAKPKKE